jgi:hypothetical protein
MRSATRYLGPSFSSSAMTASVMHTTTLAYSASMSERWMSSLFWMEKLMKFVSMSTWSASQAIHHRSHSHNKPLGSHALVGSSSTIHGGPRDSLCAKKSEDDVCVTWRDCCFSARSFALRSSIACFFAGLVIRSSCGEIMRFVAAIFLVCAFFFA